jgi:phytoene dehydrogenase-like protein
MVEIREKWTIANKNEEEDEEEERNVDVEIEEEDRLIGSGGGGGVGDNDQDIGDRGDKSLQALSTSAALSSTTTTATTEAAAPATITSTDVLIVGAGMAGLTAAVYLARAGRTVVITEQSSSIGGRARTADFEGYHFNQGPHALYLAGPAVKILQELGVKYHGGSPSGYVAIKEGKVFPLPSGLYSMMSSKLLSLSSKIEAVRFLASLSKMETSQFDSTSLDSWKKEEIRHQDFAELLETYLRVSSYSNDPKFASAGSLLAQFKLASSGGVLYVDEGWQTLVDGLRDAALDAGEKNVQILTGKKAVGVKQRSNGAWTADLSDGSQINATSLVIATSPSDAYRLFSKEQRPEVITRAAKEAIPVRVATLDVALNSLPRPDRLAGFGIDKPLYLSVHSAFAKLAPSSRAGSSSSNSSNSVEVQGPAAVIHVVKYIGSLTDLDPRATENELEALLDLMQPGWRKVLVRKRFLPNMVVSNALVTASQGGIRGRPPVKVSVAKNLYIVGDWVGREGLLLDASLSSAKRAAEDILEKRRGDEEQGTVAPATAVPPTTAATTA